MSTTNSFSESFKGIIILAFISFSTFFIFLISFEFYDNCKIIYNQSDITKIKVKIDSLQISSNRTGKSSSNSSSRNYYFNKGLIFQVPETKGFLLKYENPTEQINDYMQKHKDSLNLWVLNKKAVKYAYDDEKEINVSLEESNNRMIIFYFILYIISMLIIKFKF
ncbi:hypothetical protein [[Flexibacter] sp. ATCC 35103]|uniref:hypothetical protein n=1 Tax=[Flexibacter] sp. ATCC 35103 TaxID=1937528 RepID=UPI0009C94EA6|nr:hypothetical protein [[Flexibacter] sp. ATCC 35103]OMQ09285.1 hypothetical protein BXU01_18140 [[Flexibacter] sp. ATCC 35103]OMQ09325.1 hypothetical protein BXU01_18365 [[Flexibacter] sp. ATCC 35103]